MEQQRVVLLRRSFLAGLGLAAGGLALGLAAADAEAAPPPAPGPATQGLRTGLFLHLANDGMVSVVCHRSEMGQGIRSSLPVVIADELGADMARVTIVQAVGDKAYGDQNTDGSRSVRDGYEKMRRVGATARTMLVAAAAKRWRVPAAECVAEGHAVHHAKSKRSLDFRELVADAAKLPVPDEKTVALRPNAELKRVGGPLPLIDGPAIVTGRAQFGADVRLPGMLTAVIARPPVVGGKVVRYDGARALAVPGVKKLVDLPAPKGGAVGFQPLGGVAVVADTTWAAMRGRAALSVEWDHGPNAAYDSATYREALSQAVRAPGKVVRKVGDVDGAFAKAARTIEAEYHVPHLAHAAMEPPSAVAKVDANGCEVWAPTQNPQAARTEVARALGLDEAKVTVNVTFLGGGFGRKSKPDYVAEAALLARAMGAPVRVQWTREDDVQSGYFHSVSAQHLKAGLDADGKVGAWLHRTAFPPIPSTFDAKQKTPSEGELGLGVLDLALSSPNVRVEACDAPAHVRIGWLRSVCNIFHAFAVQSFIDEIAHARQADPRDVLLEVLGPARKATLAELGVEKVPNYGAPIEQHPVDVGRLRHVIERVTEISGWSAARKAGRAVGLAAHRSFLTYVAVVAAVSKDALGKVKVDEVWLVADAGTVINPDRARSQMEGAVVFGMSIALHGAITVKGGAVEQTNFRDYPVVRSPEVPQRIHVELVKSDAPPGGVGEPGVPPVAPAIANAVFALTKQRYRELPLRRQGV
ncbi:acylaldehyde oxidase [Sorangium cellulosum]|uniref:Acylaldehyde oxidase n=1 Tax=Sorangium cellulosum TaxID=56 RepID=A0A2L0F3N2_SORCE|nr:molybdopterin cofactor-binding domain-containing protein [Sorangium cellulosum]AUX46111.1 acylaldehyde oxidase [Sorangium cellulosum]